MNENLSQLKENILDLLWGASDFDTALHAALGLIGDCFCADCVYVVEPSDNIFVSHKTYLWKAGSVPGIPIDLEELVGQKCFQEAESQAGNKDVVYWQADCSPQCAAEVLSQSRSQSFLFSPIIDQGTLTAYFGMADFSSLRADWEQCGDYRETVIYLSKIIGIFLLKARYAQYNGDTQRRLEASLKASERRADTAYELLDSITAGVIIVNIYPDGSARPQYGNLGMYRILNLPRTAENAVVPDRSVAALEGEYFDDFFANIPEPDYSRVRSEYKAGFLTDHFTVKKYRLLRGDGTYVWVSADLSLRDVTPEYRTYYVTYTDMSEEQSLQVGLMEMLDKEKEIAAKLEKASRAKSDFLSRMSHDIRTPMNAIMGMASIAGSHIDNPSRVLDCLEKITVSSKLLLSIINEVLDMSKVESGRLVLGEEEVDLAELVQGVVTMIQPQMAEKNLRFAAHIIDVPHETVVSDMQRLQQILVNLLSNAVKYTPEEGTVLLEICENPSDIPDHACYKFVVCDNGIGMTPEFLERIFQPFERAEDERITSVQGTGLGLSICKTVAEMMGGQIQVESELGVGSRFTVTIHLRIQREPMDDHMLEGLSVLVVDDDETVCLNTCKRLRGLGMISEWVSDGNAAIEKVVQAHQAGEDYFSVIIDLRMPGLDGVQTIRRIRDKVGYELPIIMISAYDLTEQMDLAQAAGANGFITKPLFRSRLAFKLKQFLKDSTCSSPVNPVIPERMYSGYRLLLVEDNILNREIAVELLSQTGATVETAENGAVALDKMALSTEGYYDLIFMDMQMPIMDGCAATAAIRALNRADAKTIPIVAMTANAFADDRKRTREAGMNEHLSKPIDIEQLRKTLAAWLPAR